MKRILSVFAGMVVAYLVVMVVEKLGHLVYPTAEAGNFKDKEALNAFIKALPFGAFVFILLAHALGSFAGAITAVKIDRENGSRNGIIVGGIMLALGVFTVLVVPHPVWFVIADILVYIPFAWLGAKLAGRR